MMILILVYCQKLCDMYTQTLPDQGQDMVGLLFFISEYCHP